MSWMVSCSTDSGVRNPWTTRSFEAGATDAAVLAVSGLALVVSTAADAVLSGAARRRCWVGSHPAATITPTRSGRNLITR